MEKRLLLCLLLCIGYGLRAQNLVPNPSFENYAGFGVFPRDITYTSFPKALAWVNPITTSPDYYNVAAGTGNFAVPATWGGNRYARTGNGMVGLDNYGYSPEYLESKLTTPMIAGHEYYVSVYVAKSKVWNASVKNFGVQFTNTLWTTPTPMTPHIMNPTFYPDTTWVPIQGVYTAMGGEEWVTIGQMPVSFPITPYPPSATQGYMFVDDVCVFDIAGAAKAGKDTLMCDSAMLQSPHAGSKYLWSTGDSTDKVRIYTAGNYWVKTFANCAVTIDTFRVKFNASTTEHAHDTAMCGSIQLQSPWPGNQYTWSTGETTMNATVSNPGSYWVRSTKGCVTNIDTFHVRARIMDKLVLGNDTSLCDGVSVPLIPNITNALSYKWNTGATSRNLLAKKTGQYILTIVDSCKAIQRDTVNITYMEKPAMPGVQDTTACQYQAVPLIQVQGETIKWYLSENGTPYVEQPVINTDDLGIQTMYVTQSNICWESDKAPVHINVIAKPSVIITGDSIACKDAPVQLKTEVANLNNGTYLWNNEEDKCCIITTSAEASVVTVSNICGTVSEEHTVIRKDCSQCIWVPNAFTPNGDGRNDVFRAVNYCPANMSSYSIIIVNRWGQTMFQSTDIKEGWDGIFNGENAPVNTYFYSIQAASDEPGAERSVNMRGDLTLIR